MRDHARALDWQDLFVGMSVTLDFTVTPDDMAAFAALSGDRNPLHVDADFARGKGFDGVVVYGGMIVAKISQLIGMRLPGRDGVWMGLRLQFSNPLYVGQQAQIEGAITDLSAATRVVSLKIGVRAGGKSLATGAAEVLLVRS